MFVGVSACIVWIGLTSCAGDETLVYLERPVEDIYNLAMDLLLDEDYEQAAGHVHRFLSLDETSLKSADKKRFIVSRKLYKDRSLVSLEIKG